VKHRRFIARNIEFSLAVNAEKTKQSIKGHDETGAAICYTCGKEVRSWSKKVQVLTQANILFKYGCLNLFASSLLFLFLKQLI
jgi:hypothetical protein